ncbi:MAG: type IV pilus assembly protein PilM [Phycisphaerales bacterium JB039]
MGASNTSWGIEVGAGAIKALKLVARGDRLEVAEFAVIPHKKVLSTPDLDQDDAVRVALGALVGHYDLSGATVAMSVPGHSAFARFAKLPPVEPRKIPQIVRFEAQQQIPFPLEEVEWDYQTFQSPRSPDVEAGIFAITKQRINERLAVYQDAGITPNIITLSPVAAYNALAYDLSFSEDTPGAIILDIGATSTDLIVAEAGRVWIRTFPIGGHNFTQALVEKFNLSYLKAEKLKRDVEQSKHSKHILQALRPVFSDLAQDVQRSIGYYQSLHPDANLTRLIGLGSTFNLPGLRRYLKQQLQMNVYRIEGFKQLSVEGPEGAGFEAASINLATAYGLALQGLDSAALVANLMPPAVVREAMWRAKNKWFGVAAGVAVVASAALWYGPLQATSKVEASQPDQIVNQTLSEGRRLKGEAGDVTSPSVNFTAANIVELDRNRDVLAHMVNDIGLMIEDATQEVAAEQGGAAPSQSAQQGAVERPAYSLVSFKTEYLGPGGIWARQKTEQDSGPSDAELARMPPQINATLVVRTSQPEPQKFITHTIDEWLRQTAGTDREGVPYQILKDSIRWELMGPITEVAAARETDDPFADLDQRGARRPGGRVSPLAPRGGEGTEISRRDPRNPRGVPAPGQPAGPGALPPGTVIIGETRETTDARQVDEMAPLPRLTPEPEPGERIAEFRVHWRIELKPENAGQGEGS